MRSAFFVLVSSLPVLLVGCASEDAPTEPSVDPPDDPARQGTILVDAVPDTLDAAWVLTGDLAGGGAYRLEDSGDRRVEALQPGLYTIEWALVAGHRAPLTEFATLSPGIALTFRGEYTEVEDAPPIACMTVSQSTIPVGGRVRFDASCSEDPVGPVGVLQFRWDWEDDGTYDHPSDDTYSIDAVARHEFATAGSKTVRMQVRDSTGNTESAVEIIQVTTVPPPPEGFVTLDAGTFDMGSRTGEPGRSRNETRHGVTLTRSFEMAITEVTNTQYAELAQWALDQGHADATNGSIRDALDGSTQELLDLTAIGSSISFADGTFDVEAGREHHPVVQVTWQGAAAYCDWLSLRAGLPRTYDHSTWTVMADSPYEAQGYRLPTEAEWEYACRAGTTSFFSNGDSCLSADDEANYDGTWPLARCPDGVNRGRSTVVATFEANGWGLYDMHGNVWEWCHDRFALYEGAATDPWGPPRGWNRVLRGGSWQSQARHCRSANRNFDLPFYSHEFYGFRPVRSAP